MKFISNFFSKTKDGGPDSPVDAYFLIEMKGLFSIALLKFNKGSRESYHSHAFNALTWFIKGDLFEEDLHTPDGFLYRYTRSWLPKYTPKAKTHRVIAHEDSWCLTLRGSWQSTWTEYNEKLDESIILLQGRKVIGRSKGNKRIV